MNTLVLTAHGSRDPRSGETAASLAEQVAVLRPDIDVRLAFLESSEPLLADVLTALPDGHPAVVTPFLLAAAYHARHDIPGHIARAGARDIRQADVLGEDDRLVTVLRERLAELGVSPDDDHLGVMVVMLVIVLRLDQPRVAAHLLGVRQLQPLQLVRETPDGWLEDGVVDVAVGEQIFHQPLAALVQVFLGIPRRTTARSPVRGCGGSRRSSR